MGTIGSRRKNPRPCGTEAAYKRHLRHGETPCERCRRAHLDYGSEVGYKRHRAAGEYQATVATVNELLTELVAALARLFEEEAA